MQPSCHTLPAAFGVLPGYHGLSPALAGRHIQDNKGNVRMSSNTGGWEKFHVPFASEKSGIPLRALGGGIVFDGEMMQGELMVGFPKAIRPHLKPFFLWILALAGGFFAPL